MRRVPAAEPANCCFCQDALDPMLYHAYVDEGAECCQRCDYEKCILPRLRGGGLQPHTLLKSMRLLEACETGSAADVQALLPPTPGGRVAFFQELMKHDKGNLVAMLSAKVVSCSHLDGNLGQKPTSAETMPDG